MRAVVFWKKPKINLSFLHWQCDIGSNNVSKANWKQWPLRFELLNKFNSVQTDTVFFLYIIWRSGQNTQIKMLKSRVIGWVCYRWSYLSNAVRQTTGWPFLPDPWRELWRPRSHPATPRQTRRPSASSCLPECSAGWSALLSSGSGWSTCSRQKSCYVVEISSSGRRQERGESRVASFASELFIKAKK